MKTILLALALLGLSVSLHATHPLSQEVLRATPAGEEQVAVSGYVKDATSGEELIGVSIYVVEAKSGTSSNVYGYYSLSLPPGAYTLQYTYVGYLPVKKSVKLQEDIQLNVELQPEELSLKEVVVTAEQANAQVDLVQMSTIKMDIADVKKMPQLLGEVDLIRSIQLLPGVTTVGEGASGFNVRGGNIDENLILLDEAPVYNASHVFGFFSVFNADAIKDVQLQRGGIPATYGGRLSSVLDIRQKEGNMKTFSGSGGIGLISSRLLLEGPIAKDKSSFVVSARRSYADIFTVLSANENVRNSTAYFYDMNGKVNFILNENNRLFLSGYRGRDVLGMNELAGFDWGNKTGTLRWNHLFGAQVFSNVTLTASDYDYAIGFDSDTESFHWNSSIRNYNLKTDLSYFLSPDYTLDFGFSSMLYQFIPARITYGTAGGEENNITFPDKYGLESAVYTSHEWKVSDRLSLQYGLRFSLFHLLGTGTIYQYAKDDPAGGVLTDTLQYRSGDIISAFPNLEPRFSMKFSLTPESSLKVSYHRMNQYVHLVSNTTASLPVDVWTPAGPYIKPATVDQFALGYFRNFAADQYELSAEAYYKKYNNLLDFKDGAELLLNENIETEVLSGEGRAYGLEMMLKKGKGPLTGWLSYTLSRTERRVEGINNNLYYPANYDKPHDVSLVLSYQLNRAWSLSTNFTYMTGRPITYPNARYEWQGAIVPNYDNRNGARVPDYHRLDLSATYEGPRRASRSWQSSWTFGIYNAYARRNAFSVFFRQNEEDPTRTEAVRYSVLGSLVPSVTYNFNF